MAKIQVWEGTYTGNDIDELHLASQHLLHPEYKLDEVIMYTEQRHLLTLLVSGVNDSRYTAPRMTGKDTVQTYIPTIPEGELIDGVAWKYKIMGRIQRAVEIVGTAAVGAATSGTNSVGGTFSIALKDNYLQIGMNVFFYNGKTARVMQRPSGGAGYYVYNFQMYPGDVFTWATWIAGQSGTKTCFGGYSTFGERSLRGYDVMHYPDMYINHMTIQRKGFSLSGSANARNIMWYGSGNAKGFVYEQEAQSRARFLREDEISKWYGKSTLKAADGTLLSSPSRTDYETGQPIWEGDGFVEQVRGSNDMDHSGVDGMLIYEDASDMITTLKKRADQSQGNTWFCVTGSDGMQNANDFIAIRSANYFPIQFHKTSNEALGGDDISVGYNFRTLNIGGNKVVFCENPIMDDEQLFPARLNNGKLRMSSTYYWMDLAVNAKGKRNIEIRTRGREGVNRNLVYFYENGMTGEGKATSSIDAKRIEMLKENMLVVYNTRTCGISQPPATA